MRSWKIRFGGGGSSRALRAAGVLLVALALVATTGAASGQARFPDVADDHLRRLDILYAAERGWFQGYPDGTFRPDGPVAGHQLAAVVGRAFPEGTTRAKLADFIAEGARYGGTSLRVYKIGLQSPFPDVPDDHLFKDEIVNVAMEGWFQGYLDGTFRPDRAVTPVQIANVLRRVFPSGATRAELAAFMRIGSTTLRPGPPPPAGEPGSYTAEDDLLLYTLWTYVSEDEYGDQLWAAATDGTNPVRLAESRNAISKFNRSPDGAAIVYSRPVDGDDGRSWELWAVGLDGSPPRRLAAGLPNDRCASRVFWRWSPDGNAIAYEKARDDGGWELWTAVLAGDGPRRVTERLYRNSGCWSLGSWEWSPTGEGIAYETGVPAEEEGWEWRGLRTAGVAQPYDRLLTDSPTARGSWSWSLKGRIAFPAGELHPYDLWVAAGDGSDQRRVTEFLSNQTEWRWSLGGERIAYLASARNRDGYWRETQLRMENADGSAPRLLDENPAGFSGFRWSPDGSRIAYKRSVRIPSKEQLFVAAADGSEPVMWADGLHYSGLWEWSPNGESIAYDDGGTFWVAAEGREAVSLVENRYSYGEWWNWSPTGDSIAYAKMIRDENDEFVRMELWAADADGGGGRRLSQPEQDTWGGAWSPSGDHIAYTVQGEWWDELWIAAPDGSSARFVVRDPYNPFSGEFAWSPDGRNIVYGWSAGGGLLWVEGADDPAERLMGRTYEYSMEPAVREPSPRRHVSVVIIA